MLKYISEPRDWDDLLKNISKKNLTPIIGQEIYKFKQDDSLVPIDEYLSKKILQSYDVTDQLTLTLPEAVDYLNKEKQIEQIDIKEELNSIVEEIAGKDFPGLKDFLSISELDYFINTSLYNNVLAGVFKNTRKEGANSIKSINFSIQSTCPDSGVLDDLKEPFVFNVFGSLLNDPALSEEDLLEYTSAFNKKIDNAPNIISALKRNLLFLGCSFPDWMIRYILRLLSTEALHDWGTKRRIYIVNDQTDFSNRQVNFLENYKVITYKGTTLDFAKELSDRWKTQNPQQVRSKLVFLSYTRKDKEAVETLKKSIESISNVTCWYDKNDISYGDDFNDDIVLNIRKADLFIPLISANSLTHLSEKEAYINKEWLSAENESIYRKNVLHVDKFLLPVVIDGTEPSNPDVPEYFSKLHTGKAPNGNPDEDFLNQLKNSLLALQ